MIMKFMKPILAVVILAAFMAMVCPSHVQAQATIDTVLSPGSATNNTFIAAQTTNTTVNTGITAAVGAGHVALQATAAIHSGTGPSNCWVVLDESLDNVNWETAKHRFIIKPTSTTNTVITNITMNACVFLRVASIENSNVAVLTNFILKASAKPGVK